MSDKFKIKVIQEGTLKDINLELVSSSNFLCPRCNNYRLFNSNKLDNNFNKIYSIWKCGNCQSVFKEKEE